MVTHVAFYEDSNEQTAFGPDFVVETAIHQGNNS